MDLLSLPVTLVVKAPNQKVADHMVECGLDWTIRKLKEHLSNVYPSKPQEHQQKLIYSGRLLSDHLTLKDVLRQYHTDQSTHTVHLVCSPSVTDVPTAEISTPLSSSTSFTSTDSSHRNSPVPSAPATPRTDGVRHRHSHSPLLQTSPSAMPTPTPDMYQQMQGAHMSNMFTSFAGGYPNMMGAYTPEQIAWMQQVYTQQMAQYMQLYQQAGYPTPPTTPTPAMPDTPENLQQNQGQDVNNRPNQRPANQQVRMNAGAGPMFEDDDDEEGGNRDWLDWVYTFSRVAVLLSIVYFYSTLGRFVVVFSLFFLVYMYQAGWFSVRRRVGREQEEQREQNAAVLQEPEQAPVPPHPEENDQEQVADNDSSGTESQVEPEQPVAPGYITIAWSFFSTFFSSLIPQQPPAVHAN